MSQEQFVQAVLNPELPVPDGLLRPDGLPATRRFNVYRNNVIVSLVDAVAEGFPVVRKLVGDDFFRFMTREYVVEHPPTSPLLFRYGESLPDFIDGFSAAGNVPYLSDIARLELARREAWHAADARPLDTDFLAGIEQDRLPLLKFDLIPSMRLVTSNFPVQSIWEANVGSGSFEMPTTGEDVLIARPEMEVEARRLQPGGLEFLKALFDGQTLGEAAGLASTVEGFDLAANITMVLEGRLTRNVHLTGGT